MNRWITNAKLIVTGLAFLAAIATVGYEWRYVWPVRACEEKGAWWDPRDRQCLAPHADLAHNQPSPGRATRERPLRPLRASPWGG